MYVVRSVGDWIWSTVWSRAYPAFSESASVVPSKDGGDTRDAGAAGWGKEDLSCRRWMQESAGNEGSRLFLKSCRGAVPVEEKRETTDGWIAVENMLGTRVGDVVCSYTTW